MTSLGSARIACNSRCPEHQTCTGTLRHLQVRPPGVPSEADLECDECGAWFTDNLDYLRRHDPDV